MYEDFLRNLCPYLDRPLVITVKNVLDGVKSLGYLLSGQTSDGISASSHVSDDPKPELGKGLPVSNK
jgi:hypothetical protein